MALISADTGPSAASIPYISDNSSDARALARAILIIFWFEDFSSQRTLLVLQFWRFYLIILFIKLNFPSSISLIQARVHINKCNDCFVVCTCKSHITLVISNTHSLNGNRVLAGTRLSHVRALRAAAGSLYHVMDSRIFPEIDGGDTVVSAVSAVFSVISCRVYSADDNMSPVCFLIEWIWLQHYNNRWTINHGPGAGQHNVDLIRGYEWRWCRRYQTHTFCRPNLLSNSIIDLTQ